MRNFLCIAAIGLGGCIVTNSARIGEAQPPKAVNCPIHFERIAPQRAAARYDQVGAVCVAVPDDAIYSDGDTGDLVRSAVAKDACRLGGEMVTVVGVCARGTEMGVFVERRAAAAGGGGEAK